MSLRLTNGFTLFSAFSLFDVNGDGVINIQELGTLLQALGQKPSEEEVDELLGVSHRKSYFLFVSGCDLYSAINL